MAPTRGYQWKSVFLPDGTMLRTVFGGKNYHCQVENDHILYNGQAVSPSGFINAVGGVRRNAWRSTWLLRPEDKHWILADSVRMSGHRPCKRKSTPALKRASATRTHADSAPATSVPADERLPAQAAAAKSLPAVEERLPSQRQSVTRACNASAHDHSDTEHVDTGRSTPPCTCPRERRTNGDHRLSPILRDELLRLLNHTHTLSEERREAQFRTRDASRSASFPGNTQRR